MSTRIETRQIRAWLLVAVWAAIVWGLGSDGLSASQTSRLLRPFLEWVYADVTSQHDLEATLLDNDDVMTAGVLTITAGSLSHTIPVSVIGDPNFRTNSTSTRIQRGLSFELLASKYLDFLSNWIGSGYGSLATFVIPTIPGSLQFEW